MNEPSPFDNKKRDWEDTFVNIVSIVIATSILVPASICSLYVSILLIQDIIALF